MSGSIVYRPAEPADRGFLVGTFLDSYRLAHAAGLIPMDVWHIVMAPLIGRILDRPGVSTFVAAWDGEDGGVADLAGWCAVERGFLVSRKVRRFRRWCRRLVVSTEPLILYVFVKQAYRMSGIARGLFDAAGVDPELPFRHATTTAVVAELKHAGKLARARFDPLTVRFSPTDDEDDEYGSDQDSSDAATG